MRIDFAPYLNAVLQRIDAAADVEYVSTSVDLPLRAEIEDKERQADDDFDGRARLSEKHKSVDVMVGLREYAAGHVLLLGKPGAGKSTAFKRLLREEAGACLRDQFRPIPVLLELRRLGTKDAFDGHDVTLLKLIMERLELAGVTSEQQVRALLRDRRLLLLLDGLNEMPSNVRLADFRAQFIDTPMIVSSRESVTDFGIETKLHLLPLNDAQARALVTNRLGSELAARQLLDDLPDRLHDFTERPLLLNMLCSVYQKSHAIPQNQGELFRRFTHDEYAKHKPSGTVATRENTFFDFCDEILQEVAFLMMHADGDGKTLWLQLPLVDAEKWLEKRFGERGETNAASKAKQWLSDALNFHLLQPAADHGKIEFIHQTFQEYYAAEWLLRHFDDLTDDQLCVHYLNFTKWTESLVIFIGFLSDKKKAKRIISLALLVDIGLGSKLSGKVTSVFQEHFFDYLNDFLGDLNLRNEDYLGLISINGTAFSIKIILSFVRDNEEIDLNYWSNVFKIIVSVKCNDSLNYVIEILEKLVLSDSEDDWDKIRFAMIALENWGMTEELILWSKNVFTFPYFHRAELLRYIENLSDPKVLPLLSIIVNDCHCNERIRISIVEALGNFSSDDVVLLLINLLDSNIYEIKYTAAKILGKTNSELAIKPLLCCIYVGGDYLVEYASFSLKMINSSLAETHLLRTLIVNRKVLLKIFNSCDYISGNEWKYVSDINKIQNNECEFLLLSVQISCIEALGYVGSELSISAIINGLKSNYWRVRNASIKALGMIGSESSVSDVADLLNDECSIIRSNAIRALGNIGGKYASDYIIGFIYDDLELWQSESRIALNSLERILLPDVVKPIFDILNNEERCWVRKNIFDSLGRMALVESVPFFSEYFAKKGNKESYAIASLASIKHCSAIRLLISLIPSLTDSALHDVSRAIAVFFKVNIGFIKCVISISRGNNKFISGYVTDVLNFSCEAGFLNCKDVTEKIKAIGHLNLLEFTFCEDAIIKNKLLPLKSNGKSDFMHFSMGNLPSDYFKYSIGNYYFDSHYRMCGKYVYYSFFLFEKIKGLSVFPIKDDFENKIINYVFNNAVTANSISNISEGSKESRMSNIFKFNAPITAGVIGDNHGTVNVGNNQPALGAEDIAALRTFLQAWSQHQQSQITENPENSGIDAARTLETENPGLMQRIQNGGIGALTSLIGDMATGEDPISAFIKAFIAGIGGAATRP
jgi:HEAT repeat protein